MPKRTWSEVVLDAVKRHIVETGSVVFTRQELIDGQLEAIVIATGSSGQTPHQTLSRELQQMRDAGLLEFLAQGSYRWVGEPAAMRPHTKGVFVVGSHSIYEDEPERFYRFGPQWLTAASRIAGNWIVYQEPRRAGKRGYYAVAKVDRIISDPANADMYLALIEAGSFLEFGRDVPFRVQNQNVERGLLNSDGRLNNGRAVQSVRSLSDDDFNRIVDFGLVEADDILPRIDEAKDEIVVELQEERDVWLGPIDRETMLVSRTVRNRQFRNRVLGAYDATCALTGMKLINGGGRAETQAAHIMSVEAGGPDVVSNGLALSGTVHWMFDRGLISLSDDGDILLSHKINDLEGVERLIFKDRKARLPRSTLDRPHARYLQWHRTECFYG